MIVANFQATAAPTYMIHYGYRQQSSLDTVEGNRRCTQIIIISRNKDAIAQQLHYKEKVMLTCVRAQIHKWI